MTVANYIHDLLYRHDCVIVPNFGGFITNTIGAKIHEATHTFYPPTKQVSFNTHLKHNDGLLVNYIAKVENVSFDIASKKVATTVLNWRKDIQSSGVVLDSIGQLILDDNGQYLFEPSQDVNYLSNAFGLAPYTNVPVERYQQKVVPMVAASSKSKISALVKYAATAAIVLTLGTVGWNGYQNNLEQKEIAKEQKELENKIQNATFVISNPLPTINLNVTKEVAKPYHVIAGSFQFIENAEKKVNQLKAKGFNAAILGKNKWGLTQVAFESFTDRSEAFKNLAAIRKSDSKDAWILIKRFQ
ncbi:SPOR domain-containing protein [Flavobacteriaceae bacterium S356]|uniref:SPOR domain-containing protein n=1 Tax=Asprobacillus argus TaxID=3076534 RepID=A0ABU3LFT9_9FLAO|nr:SPOR domain-containing protein [Flavobacteriaceae bacterium S356]